MKVLALLLAVLITTGRTTATVDQSEDLGVEVVTILGPLTEDFKNDFTLSREGVTSTDGKADATSARLPKSLRPSHYNIRLQPFINGNFSIHGRVEMHLTVVEATDKVILNMADIITKNETVKIVGDTGLAVDVVNQLYDAKNQLYTAQLSHHLSPGTTYVFSMEFQGFLNDKLVGMYRSVYKDAQGRERWLAATQFSPTDARRAFPSFDEPSFKATFSISIARQTNMTALSNMPLIASIPIDGQDGWVWDTFNTTLPMSTYIVGFLVCDFASLTSPSLNHTIFKVWTREEAIDQAVYTRDVAPVMLTFLEDYFNIPFPLPKLDMATVPDFKFNGMENWGLILYRETALLYDSKFSSASDKQDMGYVLAHEVAHQWFGNLVTPAWWSDLWLKEGFASFMGYVALDAAEPTWGVMDQFVTDYQQKVFELDSLASTHPISVSVDHPDEISEIFDFISYRKGASIIRMMQHFLSEATFRKGLTSYLNDLKFSNAEQDDLWGHLSRAWHEDSTLVGDLTVKRVMDTWTLQKGYPLVTVTRDGTTATLTQERFHLGSGDQLESDLKWWIPVTYTTQSDPDFHYTQPKLWMSPDSPQPQVISGLPESSQWLLMNLQECGYYRVNYDNNNWGLLTGQLHHDLTKIHVTNRAQILDDALNLARSGQLHYSTTLNVTSYLTKELDFVPWYAALQNLHYLVEMFERSAGYGALRDYLLSLVVPLYDSVGFEDSSADPHLTQYKRVMALKNACKFGHKECIDKSALLYRRWMEAPSNESVLSANIQSTVLCTGVAVGGEAEWNAAWSRYLISNVGTERSHLLSAMGCTSEVWILARYLDKAFSAGGEIRKQDASKVFGAIANNPVGRDLAWNYLQDKWPLLLDYFGSGSSHLSKLIKSATKSFNTQLEVNELMKFKSDNAGRLGSAVRALDQSLEGAMLNVAWMKANYDVILEWLAGRNFSSSL